MVVMVRSATVMLVLVLPVTTELFDDMANSELSAGGISDVDEIAGVCND